MSVCDNVMTEPGTCPVPITLHLMDNTWLGQVKPHGLRSRSVVALMVPIIGEKDPGGWHGACPHSPCASGTPDLPSGCTRCQAPPPGAFLEAPWAALPCSDAPELQGLAVCNLAPLFLRNFPPPLLYILATEVRFQGLCFGILLVPLASYFTCFQFSQMPF